MVRRADDDGPRAQRRLIVRVAEEADQPAELLVDDPVQMRVEVGVALLLGAATESSEVRGLADLLRPAGPR
jgi:hypothetical protein